MRLRTMEQSVPMHGPTDAGNPWAARDRGCWRQLDAWRAMMAPMTTSKKSPRQFRLRSLLAGMTWFALILAICVNHQHAATRHRQTLDELRAAGLLPAAQFHRPSRIAQARVKHVHASQLGRP
jgi:hypothetical protein